MKRLAAATLVLFLAGPAEAQAPGWLVRCDENKVTTEIRCYTYRRAESMKRMSPLSVFIYRTKSGRWVGPLVHVMSDWPGDEHPPVLRVDDNAPITFTRARIGADHADILAELKAGRIARTQTSKWPSCRDCRQDETDLTGFGDALRALEAQARTMGWPG